MSNCGGGCDDDTSGITSGGVDAYVLAAFLGGAKPGGAQPGGAQAARKGARTITLTIPDNLGPPTGRALDFMLQGSEHASSSGGAPCADGWEELFTQIFWAIWAELACSNKGGVKTLNWIPEECRAEIVCWGTGGGRPGPPLPNWYPPSGFGGGLFVFPGPAWDDANGEGDEDTGDSGTLPSAEEG